MWISFCPSVNVGFLCFIFMELSSLHLLPSTRIRFYVFLIRGMFFIIKVMFIRNSGMGKGAETPRFCQEGLEDTYFHCLIYKYIFWNLIFRGVTHKFRMSHSTIKFVKKKNHSDPLFFISDLRSPEVHFQLLWNPPTYFKKFPIYKICYTIFLKYSVPLKSSFLNLSSIIIVNFLKYF